MPPYLPPALQVVDGDLAASRSAGRPWSTVALVPWTFNDAQPSQPSSVPIYRGLRSACSSGVHSFFCSGHRLTPNPARFALLEDYYSPSQPLYIFVCVDPSIGLPKNRCQVFVTARPIHGPKPSLPPVRRALQTPLLPRRARAGWCGTGTAEGRLAQN